MPNNSDWSRAYAIQAAADWGCWLRLNAIAELPDCQRLHFLQMACEKLSKAFLFQAGGNNPEWLRSSHAVVRKHLKTIIAYTLNRIDPNGNAARQRALIRCANQLACEIEWLSPQCDDDGRRPSNTEYPWVADGSLRVPAQHRFSLSESLLTNEARSVLKLLGEAIRFLVE